MEAPGAGPKKSLSTSGIPRRSTGQNLSTSKARGSTIPSTATRLGVLSPPSMVAAKQRAGVLAARTPGQSRVVVGLVSRPGVVEQMKM